MANGSDDGSMTMTEGGVLENNKETRLSAEQDVERAQQDEKEATEAILDWDNDPHNPLNWPAGRKALQVMMLSSSALLAYVYPILCSQCC